jgi:hypothetical protein
VVLASFEVLSIVVLHRLGRLNWLQIGWADLAAWLETTTAQDAVAAAVRVVALVLAYWITASTAAYVLARVSRFPGAVRAVEWATLPAIRRVVDGALAMTLTAASIAGAAVPALAQDPAPVVIEVEGRGGPLPDIATPSGDVSPTTSPDATTAPLGPQRAGWSPTPAGLPDDEPRPAPPAASAERELATTREVRRGDNLWTISATHLETITGRRDLGTSEVARYWRRVVEHNRPSLRSGDPDLIFPGEVIELPPLGEEDAT